MRFNPHTPEDRRKMLDAIGVKGIDELFADIPEAVRFRGTMDLPPAMSEWELTRHVGDLAARNRVGLACFTGGGAYDHYVPAAVDQILWRGEFYTAYTPYQPEIAQGTLQAIYEYQSMICELTGMDVANASNYDGASSLGEAANLALSSTGRKKVLVSRAVHPYYRQTLATYTRRPGVELVELPLDDGVTSLDAAMERLDEDVACLIIQQPNFFGCLEPGPELAEAVHRVGGLLAVSADPLSLGVLEAPGNYGADICSGDGQPLGLGLNFGGPYVGFFAAREALIRRMPGRIAGVTVDNRGRRGFVLTLQTREQHIRRERATSNICTNQALCALATTVYMSIMGREGLRDVALQCLYKAHYARDRLAGLPGWSVSFTRPFFREFAVKSPHPVERVQEHLLEAGMMGGIDLGTWYPELKGHLLFAVTEKRTRAEIDALAERLGAMA